MKRIWVEPPNINLDHQTQGSLQNNEFEKEIEKAVVSPFGYKLNSHNDRIILIKYDCDLSEFVQKHRDKPNFHEIGRLNKRK